MVHLFTGSSSCEREGVVVGSPQEGQQQLPPEEQKKQDEAGEEEWEQVGPKNKSTITRQVCQKYKYGMQYKKYARSIQRVYKKYRGYARSIQEV